VGTTTGTVAAGEPSAQRLCLFENGVVAGKLSVAQPGADRAAEFTIANPASTASASL